MRKPSQILEEWRTAAAALSGALPGTEREELEASVERLRAEYLEAFSQALGEQPAHVPPSQAVAAASATDPMQQRLADISDALLAVGHELVAVENQKRSVAVGSDAFNALAVDVERLSRRLLSLSVQQREAGEVVEPSAQNVNSIAGDAPA